MSLYGNNEALFRQVGDMVKSGRPDRRRRRHRRQPGNGFIL